MIDPLETKEWGVIQERAKVRWDRQGRSSLKVLFAPTATGRVGVREMECREIKDSGKGKTSVAGVKSGKGKVSGKQVK